MIAPASPSRSRKSQPAWHKGFLAMLPAIQRQARVAFRYLSPEAKQDAIEEVVCNTVVAYARLAELGKSGLAYPTVLARYGVAQFHAGRRVGNRLNSRDALSDYAHRQRQFMVERLDHYDQDEGVWKEALVQDTQTASVPDIVGFPRFAFQGPQEARSGLCDVKEPKARLSLRGVPRASRSPGWHFQASISNPRSNYCCWA